VAAKLQNTQIQRVHRNAYLESIFARTLLVGKVKFSPPSLSHSVAAAAEVYDTSAGCAAMTSLNT